MRLRTNSERPESVLSIMTYPGYSALLNGFRAVSTPIITSGRCWFFFVARQLHRQLKVIAGLADGLLDLQSTARRKGWSEGAKIRALELNWQSLVHNLY